MASAGPETFAPVLAALATMQANVERAQKSQAHEYLESFQKSASTQVKGTTIEHSTDGSEHKVRSLDDYAYHFVIDSDLGRGEVVCCNDPEGQGTPLRSCCRQDVSSLTLSDYL